MYVVYVIAPKEQQYVGVGVANGSCRPVVPDDDAGNTEVWRSPPFRPCGRSNPGIMHPQ